MTTDSTPVRVLSFDIEDWFHILDNPGTQNEESWKKLPSLVEEGVVLILDKLDQHNVKATHFILGWIAEKYPDLVKEISRRGHHIGCHSHTHQLVYNQNKMQFEDDLKRAINAIGEACGLKCDSYRAPGFSLTNDCLWVYPILVEHGFEHDSSLFLTKRAHGGFSDFPVFGPSYLKVSNEHKIRLWPLLPSRIFGVNVMVSGGGYFRVMPKSLVLREFGKASYLMTYFHPRDFLTNVPKVPGLSFSRQLKSTVMASGCMTKLEAALESFQFVSIREANFLKNDLPEVDIDDIYKHRSRS